MTRIGSLVVLGFALCLVGGLLGCGNEIGSSDQEPGPTDSELDTTTQEPPSEEPKPEDTRPPDEGADDRPSDERPEEGRPEDDRPEDDRPEDDAPPPTNAVCGNGQAEEGELCDGADLAGLTCRSAGFASGTVQCASNCSSPRTQSCSPLVPSAIASPGGSVPLAGALEAADPTWARPNAECAAGYLEGQHFDAFAIVNNAAQPRQIQVRADWGEGNDGFLHLFTSPWSPITGQGCLIGNDDDGDGTAASLIPELTIAPGQTLIVAVSSYSAGAVFPYQVHVDTLDPQGGPPVVDDPQPDPGAAPACGNGLVEAGEQCDGASLAGATCASAGYDFGFVLCMSDCQLSLGLCFDLGGSDEPPPAADDPTDPVPPPAGTASPIAAPGLTLQLAGALDVNDAQWARPTESCTSSGTSGQRYDAHRIVNNTSTTKALTLRGNWEGDGFLAVYTEPFEAANASTGCLDADDDHSDNGAGAQRGSQIDDMLIFPGETLVVVATTYASDDKIGDYTIDVTSRNNGDAKPVAAIAGPGGFVTTSGTIHQTDATWQRMSASCEEGSGSTHFFDALLLTNTTGSSRYLDVTGTWYEGDGYLHALVYDDANDPVAGGLCLAGNDDSSGPGESRIENLLIFSGETLVVIASSYAAGTAIGAYDIDVATQY